MSGAETRERDALVEQAMRAIEARPGALVSLVGPTASGKTALAVALAERLGGEIVSCDSVQVYRGFDVGSGKPTPDESRRAPHHMVDVLDPLEAIDAASYAEKAARAIDAIDARGKRAILCGGTFLWAKALVYGLAEAPAASEAHRAEHRAIAEAEGRSALHARLALVDPQTAARLHPNDFVRVSRALEVFALTGKPMSAWHEEHAFREVRRAPLFLAIARTPEALTARIEARVRGFLDAGWVDEVTALVAQGYGDARAMGSVGYREVRAYLGGTMAKDELATAIVRATRVFARRQRTWLNHADVTWLGRDT